MSKDKEGQDVSLETLLNKVGELETNFSNVVDELKSERVKKQEAEAERDLAIAALNDKKETPPAKDGEVVVPDVKAVVEQTLAERDNKTAEDNKKSAEEKFKNSNKEFHPDNDPGGIKFATVTKQLARFNTAGLKSEEDFLKLYTDCLKLSKETPSQESKDITPYDSTPSNSGSGPKEVKVTQLSVKEVKLMNQLGWTEERFMKQKAARPSYVQSLLEHIN